MTESTITPTLTDGDIVAWFEDIGPERAKQLLKTYNVDYRKLRTPYSGGLARDMVAKHWYFDGSPIRIDNMGNLFDGQHRLNAIIESGTTQRFLIISGLPVRAYNTTDTGLPRRYSDSLRRDGYTNASLREALVKIIFRWEAGRSLDETKRLTHSEMQEIHDKYVDSINRAIQLSGNTHHRVHMPKSLVVFSWWLFTRIDPEKAYTFMTAFTEGENIRRGHPAYALRDRLYMLRDEKVTRNEFMDLVIKAWNAFIEGREMQRVVLAPGFVTREKMAYPNAPQTS